VARDPQQSNRSIDEGLIPIRRAQCHAFAINLFWKVLSLSQP
jgi:hypothetical protein